MKFCHECGADAKNNTHFCYKCGIPLLQRNDKGEPIPPEITTPSVKVACMSETKPAVVETSPSIPETKPPVVVHTPSQVDADTPIFRDNPPEDDNTSNGVAKPTGIVAILFNFVRSIYAVCMFFLCAFMIYFFITVDYIPIKEVKDSSFPNTNITHVETFFDNILMDPSWTQSKIDHKNYQVTVEGYSPLYQEVLIFNFLYNSTQEQCSLDTIERENGLVLSGWLVDIVMQMLGA